MSIAALYDIHGNLPALEAVLDEVRTLKVDQIVVGGDVLPGPMPRATLALLLESDGAPLPEPLQTVLRWTAEEVHPTYD